MPRNNYSREDLEVSSRNPRVRAFLDAIAAAEGTKNYGDDGYNVNVGHSLFHSYAQHPRRLTHLGGGLRSDAAGRYQFLSTTWAPLQRQLGLPDFGKHSQDVGAIALIAEKGALLDVINGDIPTAVNKVRKVWASLPNAGYGQRQITLATFVKFFTDSLAAAGREIKRAGEFVWNGIKEAGKAVGDFFFPPAQAAPAAPTAPTSPGSWNVTKPGYDATYTGPDQGPPREGLRQDYRPEVLPPSWVNRAPEAAPVKSNVIMGDSIGAGMKWALPNTKNVAVSGMSISGAIPQFRHLKQGDVADVYLGSNNGPYPDSENKRQVMAFLRAADQHGVRINNWVLPGNNQGNRRNDAGLARAADSISQAIHEYNQIHPHQPPIRTIVTRDQGIQKSHDGLHLTLEGCKQTLACIAQQQRQPLSTTGPLVASNAQPHPQHRETPKAPAAWSVKKPTQTA